MKTGAIVHVGIEALRSFWLFVDNVDNKIC